MHTFWAFVNKCLLLGKSKFVCPLNAKQTDFSHCSKQRNTGEIYQCFIAYKTLSCCSLQTALRSKKRKHTVLKNNKDKM